MRKRKFFVWAVIFVCANLSFASAAEKEERGALLSIARLEGRGLSNLLLFPVEWGHLPEPEAGGPAGYFFVGTTHAVTRIFSGILDIIPLPLAYPFTKYDDSVPVNMGWGEFPWEKPVKA